MSSCGWFVTDDVELGMQLRCKGVWAPLISSHRVSLSNGDTLQFCYGDWLHFTTMQVWSCVPVLKPARSLFPELLRIGLTWQSLRSCQFLFISGSHIKFPSTNKSKLQLEEGLYTFLPEIWKGMTRMSTISFRCFEESIWWMGWKLGWQSWC